MARTTNFPGTNPFYGGIAPTYGTGIHQNMDANTRQKEIIKADYLNTIESRIQRIEYIVNQVEDLLTYPSGYIGTSGINESVPASGSWYVKNNLYLLASGLNHLVQKLDESGHVVKGNVYGYPQYVGRLTE